MNFIEARLSEMSNISKYQKKFLLILFSTLCCLRGKMNYRNLSRYSDLSEKTYSRQFRKDFNFSELNRLSLQTLFPKDHPLILATDCTYSQKSGKKTWGLDYFFSGQAGCTKKGLEVSLLALVDLDRNTAYNLNAQQTPATPKNKEASTNEETRIDFYLKQLHDHRPFLPPQVRYVVADGYYAKKKYVDGVVEEKLHLISKLRRDPNLRFLYQGTQKSGAGAKKRYDGKFKVSLLHRFEFHGKLEGSVQVYSQVMNHLSLKRDIRVVCLLDARIPDHPNYGFLFSTDLTQNVWEIIRFYKARFQIEFIFRDAKNFTGFSDCQARDKQSLHFHFNASLTALNLLRIEHIQGKNAAEPISIASYKAKHFNEHFMKHIFSKLELDLSSIKSNPHYEELRNYGAIAA